MRRQVLSRFEQMLFHRSTEELLADPEDVMGANHVTLGADMLTVTSEPTRIVPGQMMAYGTSFEGHGFYEASSVRKIGDTYYFVYSDENSNMLCYATSAYPDRDFVYRGILISNGDVGLDGREGKNRLNMTANNHGGLEKINGQWYVFYHRHTHRITYSRQACAEKVTIEADGTIRQAECTSCGLNNGPLPAGGEYPAAIACNITNGSMPHATNRILDEDIPYVTNVGDERFITNIKAGTKIVYKYFRFTGRTTVALALRGTGSVTVKVLTGDTEQGTLCADLTDARQICELPVEAEGDAALTLCFEGDAADLLSVCFKAAPHNSARALCEQNFRKAPQTTLCGAALEIQKACRKRDRLYDINKGGHPFGWPPSCGGERKNGKV